jgi:hypothetical protein
MEDISRQSRETDMAGTVCVLCGEPILEHPADPEMVRSDEHAVAKQFYPESIRRGLRKPLWTVPSHRKCNNACKADEEYFYHRYYPLVWARNPSMGQILLAELARRAKKPQSRVMIRHLLKDCKNKTPGGILLPPTVAVWVEQDLFRIQSVGVKIVQCLFSLESSRFVPRKNFDHWEMVEEAEKLQPVFARLCQSDYKAVDPRVFCYWCCELEGCHYYAMLFWGAFMFCMSFLNPK